MRGKFFRVTDCFALFQLPRSPVLGSDAIKAAHRRGMSMAHPDKPDSTADAALLLNEARRILSDPALRLRHLLELEGLEIPEPLPPHTDWQMAERVGRVLEDVRVLTPATPSDSVLLKAVNQNTAAKLEMEIQRLEKVLMHSLDAELEAASVMPRHVPLRSLSAAVFFQKQLRLLDSARDQLREKSLVDGPL